MQKDGFHTEEILCVKAVFLFYKKVLTKESFVRVCSCGRSR